MGGGDTPDRIITQTSTPMIDIDRIPDYQYAGLPLGKLSHQLESFNKALLCLLFTQASTQTTTARAAREQAEELSIKTVRSLDPLKTRTRYSSEHSEHSRQ